MYHWVAAQSSFMRVKVADAYAHVGKLVSVVKMATMLEKYTTEERRSVVRFLWAKGVNARMFVKKCFLFTVGSVYRLKRFTSGRQTFH
jgi:hypothetical protein